jgi:hypothetical protein
MHYWDGGWHHMGWMPFWGLSGVIAIVFLIWFGVASARDRGGPDSPESSRYAGGEITREEYAQKLEEPRH